MKIKVQHGSIVRNVITVGGYKFFYMNGQVMCATCIAVVSIARDPDHPKEMGKVAELAINKDCDCPQQEE